MELYGLEPTFLFHVVRLRYLHILDKSYLQIHFYFYHLLLYIYCLRYLLAQLAAMLDSFIMFDNNLAFCCNFQPISVSALNRNPSSYAPLDPYGSLVSNSSSFGSIGPLY